MNRPNSLLALALAAATTSTPLTEPAIRAFLARQDALWDRQDFAGYYATIAEDARFITEIPGPHNTIQREEHGKQQDQREAAQTFATIQNFAEKTTIGAIRIAPDGSSATIEAHEDATFTKNNKTHRRCAQTTETVAIRGVGIATTAFVEREAPCPPPP